MRLNTNTHTRVLAHTLVSTDRLDKCMSRKRRSTYTQAPATNTFTDAKFLNTDTHKLQETRPAQTLTGEYQSSHTYIHTPP